MDPEISSGAFNSAFDRGVDHNTIPNSRLPGWCKLWILMTLKQINMKRNKFLFISLLWLDFQPAKELNVQNPNQPTVDAPRLNRIMHSRRAASM
jgi:hypothetical protein